MESQNILTLYLIPIIKNLLLFWDNKKLTFGELARRYLLYLNILEPFSPGLLQNKLGTGFQLFWGSNHIHNTGLNILFYDLVNNSHPFGIDLCKKIFIIRCLFITLMSTCSFKRTTDREKLSGGVNILIFGTSYSILCNY